jgi:protein-S-isoprenylcysteine O-methyltransferase Ste14
MDVWYARGAVLAATVAMIAIRAPHGQRSRGVKVAETRKGGREIALLTLMWAGFFLPLVWVASGWPASADYALHPAQYAAGVAAYVAGLWIFHRSHADLGTNWSITLQVREGHTLVTRGVYARVRHPMYLGLLLFAVGQALVLPNWLAGPSYLVMTLLLIAARTGPEERMMRDRFGAEWDAYSARTKRLIPALW